jgi:hypothetical protein
MVNTASTGMCGKLAPHDYVSNGNLLFTTGQITELCSKCTAQVPEICKAGGVPNTGVVATNPGTTAAQACASESIAYSAAEAKCATFLSDSVNLEACILDYCTSGGDEGMVENAEEESSRVVGNALPPFTPGAPTSSPTNSPTAATASAAGDPHLTNTRGQKFDLYKTGQMEFLRVPFASSGKNVNLTLSAMIEQRGGSTHTCTRELFITSLSLGGAWLSGRPLVLAVGEGHTGKLAVLLGGVPLSPSPKVVTISEHMKLHMLNEKQFHIGVGSASIEVVYVPGPTHYLNLRALSLQSLGCKIGGLLGDDDHKDVSTPHACRSPILLDMPLTHQRSHAFAMM